MYMKKKSLIIFALLAFCLGACEKRSITETPPSNNDANYDSHYSIFRVKATSTAVYTLTLTEYADDGTTPYNTQTANQSGPFDYGFTPGIGHKISVNIQSPTGEISSKIMYKGVYLDPVVVKDSGKGSTANFNYTVKY